MVVNLKNALHPFDLLFLCMSLCWGLFIEGGVLNDIDKNVLRKVGNRNLDLALLGYVTVIKNILGELGNLEYIKKGWIIDDNQTNIKKRRKLNMDFTN